MSKKETIKLGPPVTISKQDFINATSDIKTENSNKELPAKPAGRAYTVSFTFHNTDGEILEKQIDRAISLKKRTKSKSVVIRMALLALKNCSDEKYLELYEKFSN